MYAGFQGVKNLIINSIKLKNFRSYKDREFVFSPNTNVFYGNNAEGKTNILESIYVCALGKSFRTRKDTELIYFGEEYGGVDLFFRDSSRDKSINFLVSDKNKKQIKINGVKQAKISNLFGNLLVVMFTPLDMFFAKGEPGERRKSFDILISQLNPKYMHFLQEYYKVLEQRNQLLKNGENKVNKMELNIWDEKLVELNFAIKKIREEYIKKIIPIFNKYHREISDNKEDVFLTYKTQVLEDKESTLKLLEDRCILDFKRGFTSIGIHRDDYIFEINGVNLGLFGSQGQIRTAILSLKLAEKDLILQEKGEMPVLLLDDVMSELDEKRRRFLYEKLNECQVFITCTDKIEGENVKTFEIVKEK